MCDVCLTVLKWPDGTVVPVKVTLVTLQASALSNQEFSSDQRCCAAVLARAPGRGEGAVRGAPGGDCCQPGWAGILIRLVAGLQGHSGLLLLHTLKAKAQVHMQERQDV